MFAFVAATLLASDPCSFGIPLQPAGSVVLMVTLEESAAKDLPVIGANVLNRLSVPARIDEVRKGKFPLRAGTRVALAVHSLVQSFGSDYYGDRYEVGLEPEAAGAYRIVSILPEESRSFELRGTVIGGTRQPGERLLRLDGDAAVRVRIDSLQGGGFDAKPGQIVILQLPERKKTKSICVFALHRPERRDRPYRLLRVRY